MKIFVIGNGPSLKNQGLLPGMPNHNALKREMTIGVNWVEAPTPDVKLNVDYLVWTDAAAVIAEHDGINGRELIEGSKAIKFTWHHYADIPIDFTVTHYNASTHGDRGVLARYIEDGLARKGSCIYSAVNLAYILGGDPIILLGCDFATRDGYMHFYDQERTEQTFEDTRAQVDKGTRKEFEALADCLPNYGIKMFNATEGGMLTKYPQITLKEAFKLPDPTGPHILYQPVFNEQDSLDIRLKQAVKERGRLKLRLDALEKLAKKGAKHKNAVSKALKFAEVEDFDALLGSVAKTEAIYKIKQKARPPLSEAIKKLSEEEIDAMPIKCCAVCKRPVFIGAEPCEVKWGIVFCKEHFCRTCRNPLWRSCCVTHCGGNAYCNKHRP